MLCVFLTLLCERDLSRRECDLDLERDERWSSGRRDMLISRRVTDAKSDVVGIYPRESELQIRHQYRDQNRHQSTIALLHLCHTHTGSVERCG